MATDTSTQTGVSTENTEWRGGVLAGLAGGAVMDVLLSVMMTPVIEVAIPSMYGLSGGLAGWVAHMAHSAILGVGFAALARGRTSGRRGARPRWESGTAWFSGSCSRPW